MNKAELVYKVAGKTGTQIQSIEEILNAALDIIGDTLAVGEKVTLRGFGSFESKVRAGHNGVNPNTGEPIVIPDCKVPVFKPGLPLKLKVKG